MPLQSHAFHRHRNLHAPISTASLVFLLLPVLVLDVAAARSGFLRLFWKGDVVQSTNQTVVGSDSTREMGQVMRVMTYDRAANERQAISALKFANAGLKWFRLDDGVMGGLSESQHVAEDGGALHFTGTINTNGGGFTSIRAALPHEIMTLSTEAVRIRFRGDGKTYKFIMSDGQRNTGAPMSRSPSWQVDLPTTKRKNWKDEEWEEAVLPLSSFLPSFGGGPRNQPSRDEMNKFKLDPAGIRQIGLMLSLKLSNGDANPKKTFGEGIFPFSLWVESIELVSATIE